MNRPLKGLLWAGAALAVPAAVNALIASRIGHLEQPLPGDVGYYDWIYGRVAFYRMGQGSPVLLVHSPYAGASSWEWRKIFPALAMQHTVYALDLLGFGLSEKPSIAYSGRLYAELLHDFLQDVIGERADAIGSALSASYLVNVAVRRPESLQHLVLVNPTGVTTNWQAGMAGVTWSALRAPVLGTSLYNALVASPNIERELLEHVYFDPTAITPETVSQLYTAAHQPGSKYAATAFITGRLDLPMRQAFSSLSQPVLLVWGREAYYTPITDAADLLFRHPQARMVILDECGMLPHDEKAGDFLLLVRDFLSGAVTGEMAA